MSMPVRAFIGVGSNLGERERLIEQAEKTLAGHPKVKGLKSAPIYETEPVGGPPQRLFLNTVWEIETELSAQELMDLLLRIESGLGRTRPKKNEPRSIDLDLLFFGDQVIQETHLTVPHPRLHERWFVLKPLWDLRSDWTHPVLKKSICELLDECHEAYPKRQTPA